MAPGQETSTFLLLLLGCNIEWPKEGLRFESDENGQFKIIDKEGGSLTYPLTSWDYGKALENWRDKQ